jgi:hypothetical protein
MGYDYEGLHAQVDRIMSEISDTMVYGGATFNVARYATPVCQCGQALSFHDVSLKKAPRRGCQGFQLAALDVREWRDARIPVQTSSPSA